jgi:hypothetical protein
VVVDGLRRRLRVGDGVAQHGQGRTRTAGAHHQEPAVQELPGAQRALRIALGVAGQGPAHIFVAERADARLP